jgi:hypothetical protein
MDDHDVTFEGDAAVLMAMPGGAPDFGSRMVSAPSRDAAPPLRQAARRNMRCATLRQSAVKVNRSLPDHERHLLDAATPIRPQLARPIGHR